MKRIVLSNEAMDRALGIEPDPPDPRPARTAMRAHWNSCKLCEPAASAFCEVGVYLHRDYLAEAFPVPPSQTARLVRWRTP